jgi:hypothetical protein
MHLSAHLAPPSTLWLLINELGQQVHGLLEILVGIGFGRICLQHCTAAVQKGSTCTIENRLTCTT